ncbi:MAG: hypothetical protein IPJ81_13420 [Chitinophagaceae bacterium]|nr:hypothetical protein [Chitinophagaceae bacterium]
MINKKIFTWSCIVLILIQLISSGIYAQDIGFSNDSLSRPKVFLKDEFVITENFPAISKDGNTIIFIHSDYSCCISTQEEFRMIKTTGAPQPYKLIIAPEEGLPDFSPGKKLKIIKKIDSILKKQSYYSMIAVDSFSVVQKKGSSNNYISLLYNDMKLKSNEFRLKKMMQSGFYCSGQLDVNAPPCKWKTTVQKVWKDSNNKFLLIEYGFISIGHGGDLGPQYMVVKLRTVGK